MIIIDKVCCTSIANVQIDNDWLCERSWIWNNLVEWSPLCSLPASLATPIILEQPETLQASTTYATHWHHFYKEMTIRHWLPSHLDI